ncbi:hypothetical protein ACWERF_28310 [Streptomyces griseoluteus]
MSVRTRSARTRGRPGPTRGTRTAHHNALIPAVVLAARQGSDKLLPYLTTGADPIFDADQSLLHAWFGERFPHHDALLIDTAADIAVDMTISHLILPGVDPRATAERLSLAVLRVLCGSRACSPRGEVVPVTGSSDASVKQPGPEPPRTFR